VKDFTLIIITKKIIKMKKINFDEMTREQLLQENNKHMIKFIIFAIATLIMIAIGNIPSILGKYYLDNTFFKMLYIFFFIYTYRIFLKWKAVKKEIKKNIER